MLGSEHQQRKTLGLISHRCRRSPRDKPIAAGPTKTSKGAGQLLVDKITNATVVAGVLQPPPRTKRALAADSDHAAAIAERRETSSHVYCGSPAFPDRANRPSPMRWEKQLALMNHHTFCFRWRQCPSRAEQGILALPKRTGSKISDAWAGRQADDRRWADCADSVYQPIPRQTADGSQHVAEGEFVEIFVDTPL
jgi:hypothetical protein